MTNNNENDNDYNNVQVFPSFDDMELKDNLLRSIYGYGFEKPSAIQQRAIVPLYKGGDVLAQAQSGTGKTATFSIGILQKIRNEPICQAVILAPTRELAKQIYNVISELSKYMEVNVYLSVGGQSVSDDMRELRNGNNQIVVGTPGRILDMINREVIDTNDLHILVLDEADEMLSQGFKEQIYQIFQTIPENVQVGLFSATLPPETLELSKKFLRNPTRILVKKEGLTLDGIKQFYLMIEKDEWKFEALCELYDQMNVGQSIVYCNKKQRVEELATALIENDFQVAYTHGGMSQDERNRIMKGFRASESRVLITTDLLARGIDVQGVNVVINFDIPFKRENYIHRIGRSGRYGRKGVSLNFVTPKEAEQLENIENYYSTSITELPEDFEKFFR
jgi:translation initiation factor 4A